MNHNEKLYETKVNHEHAPDCELDDISKITLADNNCDMELMTEDSLFLNNLEFKTISIPKNMEQPIEADLNKIFIKLTSFLEENFLIDGSLSSQFRVLPKELRSVLLTILTSFKVDNKGKYNSFAELTRPAYQQLSEEIDFLSAYQDQDYYSNKVVLTDKYYIVNTNLQVHTEPSPIIKVYFNCLVELKLDRKYSSINLSFKGLTAKFYHRVKYFKSIKQENMFVKLADKLENNGTWLLNKNKNSFIKEIDYMTLFPRKDYFCFNLKREFIQFDDLKQTLVSFIFKDNIWNKLPTSKGFCFTQSTKSYKSFNCNTCTNSEQNPILRIYFLEEQHKKCRIHLCNKCYSILIRQNYYYKCFICREFRINFSRISKVSGGKQKKVYESNEVIVLDC